MSRPEPPSIAIDQLPGHLIRRLHQIAVGVFHQEAQDVDVTPPQYAVLQTVHNQPGIDQRTLALRVALDTSNTAGLVDRLQARGWLVRNVGSQDRRVRALTLTDEGRRILLLTAPKMARAQARILAGLSTDEAEVFLQLLAKLVTANNQLSRAPVQPADAPEALDG